MHAEIGIAGAIALTFIVCVAWIAMIWTSDKFIRRRNRRRLAKYVRDFRSRELIMKDCKRGGPECAGRVH
jgi:hypothetical protein